MNSLGYISEDDKCYGATGVAISIMVYDCDELLSAVSLDAAPDSMIELANEFYFTSRTLSPADSWKQMLQRFNITTAMTLGNAMCRSMVYHHKPLEPALRTRLHDIVAEEGHDVCALEDDEIERIFDKIYNSLYRVFNHRGVQEVADDFADTLKRVRRMTRMEVVEQLRALRML